MLTKERRFCSRAGLSRLGFEVIATLGTAARLLEVGMEVETVFKVNEGRPNIVDHIKTR